MPTDPRGMGEKVDNGPLVFLEMAGRGCISGNISEWPQLVPACRWAVEQIKAHEAAVQRRVEEAVRDANKWKASFCEAHDDELPKGCPCCDAVHYVAAAREEERERCAKIAEDYPERCYCSGTRCGCIEEIAAAIRSTKEAKAEDVPRLCGAGKHYVKTPTHCPECRPSFWEEPNGGRGA